MDNTWLNYGCQACGWSGQTQANPPSNEASCPRCGAVLTPLPDKPTSNKDENKIDDRSFLKRFWDDGIVIAGVELSPMLVFIVIAALIACIYKIIDRMIVNPGA
jgi:hypothetical protein